MKQNWIPVTEKMPEEHDSMFARFKGTDDWDPCFFEKISRDVFVTLRDKKGNTAVAQAHTTDGKWRGNMLVDKDMAEVIAQSGVAACVMHNKDNTQYESYVKDVVAELKESVDIAHNAGVKDSQIVLDPGVGFGKDYEQNLSIIKNVDALQQLGYPILLGTSRKSVIGLTLNVDKDDRMAGTVATTVMGYEKGCSIFRVHDVKENYQALMMAKAIKNERLY